MARVKIAEFGVIQKTLANAVVTIYEADENGENTGTKATIYQASTGSLEYENPQTLDENGKLSVDCWIEVSVVAAISGITERTERALRKIRVNPMLYPLPVTSSAIITADVEAAKNTAETAASTATTAAATATTAATTATTQAGIATAAATAAASDASDASDSADAAQEWANNDEDVAVSVAAGGDGSTTFSAKHWSAKAEEAAEAADSGSVKISANDTTPGFLNGKLLGGTNITLTEGNDGGDETLTVSVDSHTHTVSQISDAGALAAKDTVDTADIDDDAVTAAKLADTAVSAGSYTNTSITVDAQGRITAASSGTVGLSDVSQGDLNTSTGTISGSASVGTSGNNSEAGTPVLLPGGQYGFFPENRNSTFSGTTDGAIWVIGNTGASYANYMMPVAFNPSGTGTTASDTIEAQQRYVTSSPPFDLGDGEAGGFVFLLLNASGDVVAHYAADVPPWGYNGPTNIRADKINPDTGKKYRKMMMPRTIEEIRDGALIEYQYQEITQAIKNADMDLLPHPFGAVPPGHKVVMLDPMDEKLRNLIEYQNAGGEFSSALINGKIYTEDENLNRKGPRGIKITPLKFKRSG